MPPPPPAGIGRAFAPGLWQLVGHEAEPNVVPVLGGRVRHLAKQAEAHGRGGRRACGSVGHLEVILAQPLLGGLRVRDNDVSARVRRRSQPKRVLTRRRRLLAPRLEGGAQALHQLRVKLAVHHPHRLRLVDPHALDAAPLREDMKLREDGLHLALAHADALVTDVEQQPFQRRAVGSNHRNVRADHAREEAAEPDALAEVETEVAVGVSSRRWRQPGLRTAAVCVAVRHNHVCAIAAGGRSDRLDGEVALALWHPETEAALLAIGQQCAVVQRCRAINYRQFVLVQRHLAQRGRRKVGGAARSGRGVGH
eukprot:1815972-Prymnesium_polylepis.4